MPTQKFTTNNGKRIVGQSTSRYVRCSPRKIRLIADMIRNKPVAEAFRILAFTQRPSAVPFVVRALKAAAASARDVAAEPENLLVGELIIDDAPQMKRTRPASMGRAVRVRKRQSHIFLGLTEN